MKYLSAYNVYRQISNVPTKLRGKKHYGEEKMPPAPPPDYTILGAPPPKKKKKKNRNSSDQQFFLPCCIKHLFLIIITPRSSNLVENFLFYEYFLMDCYFGDLPDFQSFEARLMTASAAHAPTHTSIQPATKKYQCQWRAWIINPCNRQYTDHWTQYSLNLWTAEAVNNRASEVWKSGKSRKWQSIRNYKKFSTNFDDLGVIIMRKRCSIQQGE